MRWLIGTGLRLRRLVVVVAIGVVAAGVFQLSHSEIDTLPEFEPPTVEVQTEALGLSSAEVEQLITVPLEQDLLDGVAWLASIRSESMTGLSSIQMVFEPGTDILRARQAVQERISQAAGLPNVSAPPQMLQPESSTSRVMMIGLSSDQLSLIQMGVLARWTIRPRLLGVPGVANVSIWGQRERQLQVQVDPHLLSKDGVSLQQVIETTGNSLWASPLSFLEANTPGTGGFIDTPNQRISIQHLQPIVTAADLAQIPLEDTTGARLRLRDIARVVEDHQPLIGDAVLTGGPGLLLVIEKAPGANTVDVTNGVEGALDALEPGLKGITIDRTIYRPATYVERATRNDAVALAIAFVLLMVALGALLAHRRAVAIVAIATLTSLSAAILVLRLRDATFDALLFAGLLMGLVLAIHDAVADTDALAGSDDPASGNGTRRIATLLAASLRTRTPLAYATVAVAITCIPFLFLQDAAAAFFPPLILSYLIAVACSTAVALIVTPALAAVLRPRTPASSSGSIRDGITRPYARLLPAMGRRPTVAIAAAGVLVVIGMVTFPMLTRSLVPSFQDADVLVRWNAPPGTSLTEMDRITRRVTDEVRSLPGVHTVAAHVGRAVTSDEVVGVDSGQLWVSIDPEADRDATVASIEGVVRGYPGMDTDVLSYPDARIDTILDKSRPVTVRVFGQDLGVLHAKAQEIQQLLGGIDGVVNPRVQLQAEQPTVEVEVNLTAAERYGIVPGDVRRAAATLFSGIGVGSLFEEQKVFDVVVWGAPSARTSVGSIEQVPIDTPGGDKVLLGKVADVRVTGSPTVIRHQDISRSVDVTADVQNRNVGAVLGDVERELRGITFPLEYRAEVLDTFDAQRAADRRLLALALAAAIGVFLLLQAAFRSWRLAAVTFLALSVALAGGAIAIFLTGRVVSLGSIAGLLVVLALAIRIAVSSIARFQELARERSSASAVEVMSGGAAGSSSPIVVSLVATVLVMLPFAISGGAPGHEFAQPLAVVVIGGSLAAALLGLFVLPCLYVLFAPATPGAISEFARPDTLITVPDVEPALDPVGRSEGSDEGS